MTTETIWQKAARLLRENAHALFEAHTDQHDNWNEEHSAKAAHNDLIRTANEIELFGAGMREHILVLCDMVEEEVYDTRRERCRAAIQEVGLGDLLRLEDLL